MKSAKESDVLAKFIEPVFATIQSNIVGQAGMTSYTEITATNAGP
jgi:hypothetical protein